MCSSGRFPIDLQEEVWPAGGRGDRLRFHARPARRHRPSVLQRRSARATCGSRRATTSISCPARCSARCTKRATASTSKACRPIATACRPGEAVSLGIHESQSRMWENLVGRSRAFWEHFFPQAQADVPRSARRRVARRLLLRDQRRAAVADSHRVGRSHVQPAHPDSLRAGAGAARTTSCAWPICRRRGTRSTASTWASSRRPMPTACCKTCTGAAARSATSRRIRSAICTRPSSSSRPAQDLGDLHAMFRRGEFLPLRDWLRKNIHSQGRRYPAAELARRVTGAPLSHDALMRHLRGKFSPLYDLP